jgi:hypothetical protein
MCNVKPPNAPCGVCQANRINAVYNELTRLCDPKKLRDHTAEELIRQAFELGKTVHVTR